MNEENKYILNGKGVLGYANIKSVLEYGTEEDLLELRSKIVYALEKEEEKLAKYEKGFSLLGIDYQEAKENLEALKFVKASKKQIKNAIGAKSAEIEKYGQTYNKVSFYGAMKNKIDEARGQ